MDTQFVWQEDFNIGVDVIDKEHQKLLKLLTSFFPSERKQPVNGHARRN